MLTNIVPGFYRMRNGNLAIVNEIDRASTRFALGYMQEKGRVGNLSWTDNGQVFVSSESSYDLMERIEC